MADQRQRELDTIKRSVELLANAYGIALNPMTDEASIIKESERVLPMVKEMQERRR